MGKHPPAQKYAHMVDLLTTKTEKDQITQLQISRCPGQGSPLLTAGTRQVDAHIGKNPLHKG